MPDQQNIIEIRICRKCGEPKPKLTEFILDNRKKPTHECRACGGKRQGAWANAKRAATPEPTIEEVVDAIFKDRDKIIARLLARRQITERGCWEWTGARRGKYGKLSLKVTGRRDAQLSTHRLSAIIFGILDPFSGLLARHKCDNPPCFNPDDLFGGDHSDNLLDAFDKGLYLPPHGETHHWAVLSDIQTAEIKSRLRSGERAINISRSFPEVTPWAIYSIKRTI